VGLSSDISFDWRLGRMSCANKAHDDLSGLRVPELIITELDEISVGNAEWGLDIEIDNISFIVDCIHNSKARGDRVPSATFLCIVNLLEDLKGIESFNERPGSD
jgi:hypothetical protein